MNWKKMFTKITGSVDEELQRRNEFRVAENGIVRTQSTSIMNGITKAKRT